VKKIAVFIILVGLIRFASAQSKLNELTVDRPGVAETPFTVAPKNYQFEIGFDYFKRSNGDLYHLPVVLFRTGLSQKTEFRLSSRNALDKTDSRSLNMVSPFSAGIKTHVIRQKDWIPETDVLANLVVPINPTVDQSAKPGYEFLLLFQNDFYPNSALNYNVGYLWDHVRGTNMFTISACYNYLPSEKINLFAEYFCYMPDGWWGEQGADGGITFLVADNVQLDLSAGYSLLEGKNNLFASSGISFRIY
jgi:hypothetical protein